MSSKCSLLARENILLSITGFFICLTQAFRMATHIDPRPYSSSEVRRVKRFAKKQPTTLVFEDRNRVPIEDDDDSTGADADGGFDDDDEFDYPDIPVTVDEDVESDFGDESYSATRSSSPTHPPPTTRRPRPIWTRRAPPPTSARPVVLM